MIVHDALGVDRDDVSDADVQVIDAGHRAIETCTDRVTSLTRRFLDRTWLASSVSARATTLDAF